MKYLLWILLLFAAAVALVAASHNPGFVLLVYPPYRIELSLTLFIALLLFAFLSGYRLLRLTVAALQLPAYVRKFRMERAQKKSRELLDEALKAFFEERYAASEKASARAMELGDNSAIHPIIAAHSAHKLRKYEKRDAYLAAAEGMDTGDVTMRLIAAARFMIEQRDPQGALNVLRELRDSGIKSHTGMLSLELKAQQQAGNWDEVLNLLGQLEKRGAIEMTVSSQLRQQAWMEKIRQQKDLTELTTCLINIPSDFMRRGMIVAAAARALIQHGGSPVQLLTDSLNAQWESELVMLYGDCQSGDVSGQIKQAEKWLNQHNDDAVLLQALGKLCMHQRLWGKAQNYLDASISVSPSNAAYHALGQLAEQSGKAEEALRYYQQAAAIKDGGA